MKQIALYFLLTACIAVHAEENGNVDKLTQIQNILSNVTNENMAESLKSIRDILKQCDPELTANIVINLYVLQDNWKKRWDIDTKELADDLKKATAMLANESFEKVKAQNTVDLLSKKLEELESEKKKGK